MLRQGAVQWNVNRDRLESIAEHTFGCMILAIGLKSELNVNVNLAVLFIFLLSLFVKLNFCFVR